jgi:hypothetical protein
MAENYKKETEWDKSHKLCKVFLKKDKNGNGYFIGEFNFNNTIKISKNTASWAKEGEYSVEIIPIKHVKTDGNSQPSGGGQTIDPFGSANVQNQETPF